MARECNMVRGCSSSCPTPTRRGSCPCYTPLPRCSPSPCYTPSPCHIHTPSPCYIPSPCYTPSPCYIPLPGAEAARLLGRSGDPRPPRAGAAFRGRHPAAAGPHPGHDLQGAAREREFNPNLTRTLTLIPGTLTPTPTLTLTTDPYPDY